MRSILILALVATAVASPLDAQRRGQAPARPPLPAAADTNDAAAYYERGVELLRARPDDAATLFHWAGELRPSWAEALYGEYVATLMSDAPFLSRYMAGERATRRSTRALRADSLYLRALRADPFVQHRFEGELMRLWIATVLAGADPAHIDDRALLMYYAETVMRDIPPLLRARVLASRGQTAKALESYDEALRQRGSRRKATRRWLFQERARLFAQAGNTERAVAELRQAVQAGVEADEESLVFLYESKAALEHGIGLMHERAGAADSARDAYGRALAEDLSYHPAHQRLAALALAAGDTATALMEMRLAAETGANDVVARTNYGILLAGTGSYPEAEAELLAATQMAPAYADPWLGIGMVRDWQGRASEAGEAYRAFLTRGRRDDPRRAAVEGMAAALVPPPAP